MVSSFHCAWKNGRKHSFDWALKSKWMRKYYLVHSAVHHFLLFIEIAFDCVWIAMTTEKESNSKVFFRVVEWKVAPLLNCIVQLVIAFIRTQIIFCFCSHLTVATKSKIKTQHATTLLPSFSLVLCISKLNIVFVSMTLATTKWQTTISIFIVHCASLSTTGVRRDKERTERQKRNDYLLARPKGSNKR